MGFMSDIIAAWKATRRPAGEADTRYTAATVRTSDTVDGRYSTLNPRDFGRVARAVTGSIWNAATIVSRAASSDQIKLYRPMRGSSRGKRIGKHAADFLRGNCDIKPHAKAMAYANNAGDIEEVMDHPALDLLNNPDPTTTSADFFLSLYWFREVAGSTFIWNGIDDAQSTRPPSGLYLLLPQHTRPLLDKRMGLTGYHYGRSESDTVVLPMEHVVVSRWMADPFNPYLGISWVDSVASYSDMENAAIVAEVHRWRNSAQPGMIVKAPTEYNPDQMVQLAEAFNRKGGPFNAGRTTFVRGDVEVVQPNSKPHELNYEKGLAQCEAAIYRHAGVPDPIWKMNDAIQSNAAQGSIQWKGEVYNRQKAVASDLTEWLLPMFGVQPGEMWFAYANPVQEDQTAIVARIRDAFIASAGRPDPVVDANEYRAALGLDPREETTEEDPTTAPVAEGAAPALAGADVAATALNGAQVDALSSLASQVALGQLPLASARAIAVAAFPMVPMETIDAVFNPLANFTPETPNETPKDQQTPAGGDNPDDTGSDDSGGSGDDPESEGGGDDTEPEDQGDAAKARGKGAKPELVGRWEWSGKCGCGKRHARKADPTDESIEARIFRAVRSWAEDALKRGVAAIGPDGSFDISSLSSSELEGLLKASISEAFRAGAVSMTAQYAPDAEPLTSEAARQYIAQYNFDLVSGVTETMADQMRTTIDAGLEQGKTINEIQQELTDKIPEVSLNRAEVIARAETSRAYQHGSLKQAEELGFDSKEWLLSGNPCGLCEGADRAVAGKKVPIKEPFFKAGDTIAGTDGKVYVMSRPVMAASDIHPQCGCVGVPMVTEEES